MVARWQGFEHLLDIMSATGRSPAEGLADGIQSA
jgi:hypothetical protein